MYAVQVMNFLKLLILRALGGRKESNSEPSILETKPWDETGRRNPQLLPESCDETVSPFRPAFEEKPTTDEPTDTSRSFRDGITLDVVGSTSAVDGLNLNSNSKSNEGERMKVDGESAVRAEMQNDGEELKGIDRVS